MIFLSLTKFHFKTTEEKPRSFSVIVDQTLPILELQKEAAIALNTDYEQVKLCYKEKILSDRDLITDLKYSEKTSIYVVVWKNRKSVNRSLKNRPAIEQKKIIHPLQISSIKYDEPKSASYDHETNWLEILKNGLYQHLQNQPDIMQDYMRFHYGTCKDQVEISEISSPDLFQILDLPTVL